MPFPVWIFCNSIQLVSHCKLDTLVPKVGYEQCHNFIHRCFSSYGMCLQNTFLKRELLE